MGLDAALVNGRITVEGLLEYYGTNSAFFTAINNEYSVFLSEAYQIGFPSALAHMNERMAQDCQSPSVYNAAHG